MTPKEIIAKYWDLRSESYSGCATPLIDTEIEMWRRCLAHLIDEHVQNALDVGVGAGFLSNILTDMGIEVTGIDISRGMLYQAQSAFNKKNIRFCQGDAENLPFKDDSFDLVTSRHLLWTLPDPEKAIREWVRVLRRGCMVIVIDGCWFNPSPYMMFRRYIASVLSRILNRGTCVKFGALYNPIKDQLPLYHTAKPDQILVLLKHAGLIDPYVDRLEYINRFYRRHAFIEHKISYVDPEFLVTARKSLDGDV
ncbi:MAG TPA: class I SAM-dependent methyltransferase [Methanothrix sp.]|nr:class I SAM-dependent methyltransferase [Methanothrix sp.]HPO89170.1 class I SAM-dependent methyltransferase [Methanothrix sp.]